MEEQEKYTKDIFSEVEKYRKLKPNCKFYGIVSEGKKFIFRSLLYNEAKRLFVKSNETLEFKTFLVKNSYVAGDLAVEELLKNEMLFEGVLNQLTKKIVMPDCEVTKDGILVVDTEETIYLKPLTNGIITESENKNTQNKPFTTNENIINAIWDEKNKKTFKQIQDEDPYLAVVLLVYCKDMQKKKHSNLVRVIANRVQDFLFEKNSLHTIEYPSNDFVIYNNNLIRYYLHTEPNLMSEKEWIDSIACINAIREREKRETPKF